MPLSAIQALPSDESFEAPDWLTNTGASARNCLPHFFWYVGWTPTTGVDASAHTTYPFRSDGELPTIGTQLLYKPNGYQGLGIPTLMTDTAGREDAQRAVLCREEAAFNYDDLDVKVVFGLQLAGTTQLGRSQAGREGMGPGPAGRIQSSNYAGSETSSDDNLTEPQSGAKFSNFNPGGMRRAVSLSKAQVWSGWKGNSVIFRAGAGEPQVDVASSPRSFITHVDHYAFTAYPVADGADTDLYFELWQVKYTGTGATDGTPRRLMQQIVNDGAQYIDFSKPYHLRVEVVNDGSDPQINCFIGAYIHQTTGASQREVQCFKDDVFANNTYTVGTSVTHTASTGNVSDRHADHIRLFTDKTIGWTMGRDRYISVSTPLGLTGAQYAGFMEGVYGVEVTEIIAETIRYCDLFDRVGGETSRAGRGRTALAPVTGRFGVAGGQMNGMFSFDAYADSDYESGNKEIRRLMLWTDGPTDITTPNDYVLLDYDADDSSTADEQVEGAFRAFIHQRPSTQFYNHNRSIDFKPGAETGTEAGGWTYRFGILLRGASTGIQLASMAYYIEWITDGDGTITSVADKIAKIKTSYDSTDFEPEVIASLTHASVSSRPLYDGNFHTLGFDAYSNTEATGPNAAAVYECTYEGVAVDFTDTAPPQQSTADAKTPVNDIDTEFFGGRMEGFFFYCSQSEYNTSAAKLWNLPIAKNWTEGTLVAEPI